MLSWTLNFEELYIYISCYVVSTVISFLEEKRMEKATLFTYFVCCFLQEWQRVISSKSMILVYTLNLVVFLCFDHVKLMKNVDIFLLCFVLFSSEKRRAEAARIREKYPDRIPVRVQ